MKKGKPLFNYLFVLLGIFILLIVGFNNFNKTHHLIRGEPESYSITLSSDTNKLTANSDFVSGASSVKTGLNNSISFDYNNLKSSSSVWQIIEVGGSFENTIPISGLTSMLITKDADTHIGVYWSPIQLFDEEHFIEFDTNSGSTISTSFNDELPNYFKVVALGDNDASISSISIDYSCVYDLPDTLKIGMYPQTKVTDANLINALNSEAGVLPTAEATQNWTSYNYYIGGSNATDFMWYQDVSLDDEQYRGVYFTSYRPYYTTISSSTSNSYQDDNGYTTNTRYWFKYEQVVWDVLSVNEAEGPLLLSNKLLDSQEYFHLDSGTRTIDGKTIYPNNYKYSNVRSFLNNNFYDTAFNIEEKSLIATTNVDNSVFSTGYSSNQYACDNTNDNMFLLSYQEATNTTYGFNNNASRTRQATDYAKAMGVYVYSSNGNSRWWLRSPDDHYSNYARYVYSDGVFYSHYVLSTNGGLLPAFRINR